MKKIRKITAIIMLIAVLCVFASCEEMVSSQNSEPSIEAQAEAAARMQHIASGGSFFAYYRDTITDVIYLLSDVGDAGGLTVMLDPETGLPLTYARFVELYENSIDTTTSDFN